MKMLLYEKNNAWMGIGIEWIKQSKSAVDVRFGTLFYHCELPEAKYTSGEFTIDLFVITCWISWHNSEI